MNVPYKYSEVRIIIRVCSELMSSVHVIRYGESSSYSGAGSHYHQIRRTCINYCASARERAVQVFEIENHPRNSLSSMEAERCQLGYEYVCTLSHEDFRFKNRRPTLRNHVHLKDTGADLMGGKVRLERSHD